MSNTPLLAVKDLSKIFPTSAGDVHALKNVSFDMQRGSVVGLVGESGSGKTTLGRSILRLIEPTSGSVKFDGTELTTLNAKAMKAMRKRVQIIFQDPFSSLNPRMKIRDVIGEALVAHNIGKRGKDRSDRVAALLEEVGLDADHMSRYPHEFSGGQRQRIGIARALAVDPEFIVADECVSALDVSVQAQILNLMQDLRDKRNLTILFIAHDLSVVEYLCDQVVVLYLGRIAEQGNASKVYQSPAHPYTQALLSAVPVADPTIKRSRKILVGDIPSPLNPPSGCVFRTRCEHADDVCKQQLPLDTNIGTDQMAACHKIGNLNG